MISNDTAIELYVLRTLRKALELEGMGIKFKGPSRMSIAKKQYGLKGNRQSILKQLDELIGK
tara:strand:+ start:207 stop:392 length:186 start_codon:yes stop_codon:yes gene_type:complete